MFRVALGDIIESIIVIQWSEYGTQIQALSTANDLLPDSAKVILPKFLNLCT